MLKRFRSVAGAAALVLALGSFATPAIAQAADDDFTPIAGAMNWDFVTSFRDYVGRTPCTDDSAKITGCEDKDGVDVLAKGHQLLWGMSADNAVIKVSEPDSQIKFSGTVHWVKYGGILDVTLANPTIDLANKKLLVDVANQGTMVDETPVSETQAILADLNDLQIEKRDGYLVVHSKKPVLTDLATRAFGFYGGQIRQPLVAVIKATEHVSGAGLPEPELAEIFPGEYASDDAPLLSDPDEPVKEVEVPDPVLRRCIIDELKGEVNLREGLPIVNKHMEMLQAFTCINPNKPEAEQVKSLEGLQHAKNLSRLRVNRNKISDLSPLKGLKKLVDLDAGYNELTSLAGLEDSPKLTNLAVENNRLTNLDGLKNLASLTKLDAYENAIIDISGLPEDSENLESVDLNHNKINDISALAKDPYLRRLNLSHNRIVDPSPLANLRVIERVDLRHNFIEDFSSLTNWEGKANNLQQVRLDFNKNTDLSAFDWLGRKLRVKKPVEMNPEVLKFEVKIEGGTADAQEYPVGATVSLTADAPSEDKVFETWEAEGVTFADKTATSTSFVMPAKHVKVTAVFADIPAPETPNQGKCESQTTYSGNLNWGLKSSFRDYIKKGPARGAWELLEGASGEFVFPLADGQTIDLDDFSAVNFTGKVRFTGHHGQLDLSVSDPQIVKQNEQWKLSLVVASKPLGATEVPAPKRIDFANLSAPVIENQRVSFKTVTLTDTAVEPMGGFYAAGKELDPLAFEIVKTTVENCTPEPSVEPSVEMVLHRAEAPAPAKSTFKDVFVSRMFAGEIAWMASENISTGYKDGTYGPLKSVNRDAMAAFLYRAAGSPAVDISKPAFKDVPKNNQFFKEIAWMRASGISTGWDDGTYRPLAPVSREAMAAFLYRFCDQMPDQCASAINPDTLDVSNAKVFKDVAGSQFGREITWLAAAKVSTGWDDGTFHPGEPIRRDAMAAFLYRLKHNHLAPAK
ncbi:HtaA domain-containing protein [Boudabousia marimammalium]|uniref:SLH domain-containing protein n=1 Tax=Boudabousia marimammalium TaxID=156892 RepID=A0A1Q5PR09_9ACTO|nr:HtaA domain-containing protein [Boudabousia marimammalium]OKL49909.1 hypothetical protein BM477_03105 [Boudabousia marimammalium]